ncbi:type III secretion protein [Pseudomonas sp. B21-056]|jgi:hypothetical protein|uniref:type III secretion protein n=1 Tax=Pseudomonas sp. B21-056 TaxID=2895495 RepID=UPI002230B49C|nr:type III secretion protein [Pseudomonas sp. B21-056]UZE25645.1 type III secretion protein [Pseudomonas sp. B21-056]
MEFSDFADILDQWSRQLPATPLDCWIDDANARLAVIDGGVCCSIELLDPYDASDPQRLAAVLGQGGASLACSCEGALAIDPQTRCVVLISWMAVPCNRDQLLSRLESLANQRAAMLSLTQATLHHQASTQAGRTNLNQRQPGV